MGLTQRIVGILVTIAISAPLIVGSLSIAPAPATIGLPPTDLTLEPVVFDSPSGSRISGWFAKGEPLKGAVLLLHGIRANRLAMVDRARLLNAHGLAVLLIDLQAHGESTGGHMTFGHLEAKDARAAFDLLRTRAPLERIGVLGTSLGGAAAILSDPPLEAYGMVLEAVYGDIGLALENRLVQRVGMLGRWLAPMLLWQIRPRLGFDPALLRPAERISAVRSPVLLIAGEADTSASLAEMRAIYDHAPKPKELWVIPGAGHVDFQQFAPADYNLRVARFLIEHLTAR